MLDQLRRVRRRSTRAAIDIASRAGPTRRLIDRIKGRMVREVERSECDCVKR
jgi:hypothetical protein